jgi:predicted carbohydrate-binding protein with CBM48
VRAGAHCEGDGVRFAVFSSVADGVDVCVFDEGGGETRHPLVLGDGGVWDGHVPGAGHGTRYGFRVHGPWDPGAGLRCNAAKLLLDPTRAPSWAVSSGTRPSTAPTRPTPPHMFPAPWWVPSHSIGAATDRRARRSPTRSSTRPTSRG